MLPHGEDAPLEAEAVELIPRLAELYDRFAHTLDPDDPDADLAERAFVYELTQWFESLPDPKPTFDEFRLGIIVRCRKHIRATQRHPAIPSETKGGVPPVR